MGGGEDEDGGVEDEYYFGDLGEVGEREGGIEEEVLGGVLRQD